MSRFFIHSKTLSYPPRLNKSTGSPEPSLITFMISTSPYGFIMLGSSDSKKKKKTHGHCLEVLHVANTRVCILLISSGGNNARISCGFCLYAVIRIDVLRLPFREYL